MSVEQKVKALSVLASRLTPKHLQAEMSPPELMELKKKINRALELHSERESASKPPGKMSDKEFTSYRDRLFRNDDSFNER